MGKKEEAKELGSVCEKIVQIYRIRLQCLFKRDKLLQKFSNQPELIKDEENQKILLNCISRERKLLKISRMKDKSGELLINHVKKELKKSIGKLSGRFQIYYINFGLEEVANFLQDVLLLLKAMEKEIKRVEKRIFLEEKALISKKADHFEEFFKQWSKEVEENEKTIRIYQSVIDGNKTIFKKIIELERKKAGITDALLAGGSSIIAAQIGKEAVFAVIILVLLKGFVIKLQPLFNYQYYESEKDLKILRKLY